MCDLSDKMTYGIVGGVLWALDTVVLALAMGPFEMAWVAVLVSCGLHDLASVFWMCTYTTIKKKWKGIGRALRTRSSRMVMAAALLGGPVGMLGYVFALQFLGAPLTSAVSAFYPGIAVLCGHFFFRERISKEQIIGLGIMILCIALMSAGDMSVTNFGLGILAALCRVFGWGLEGVIIQHSMKEDLDNEVCLFLRQMTSAAVFCIVLIPIFSSITFTENVVSASGITIVLAALAGTCSYLFYYKAIGKIGASRAMPLNSAYCAWTVLFAWLIQGQVPTIGQILLAIGIVAGAVLCANEKPSIIK